MDTGGIKSEELNQSYIYIWKENMKPAVLLLEAKNINTTRSTFHSRTADYDEGT